MQISDETLREVNMEWKKITAIIRSLRLESVERRLQEIGVKGISVSKVKGYGEYADYSSSDWKVTHARIEIFIDAARVQEVVNAIMETACSGHRGDGIVAVLPVERIYRIREKTELTPEQV